MQFVPLGRNPVEVAALLRSFLLKELEFSILLDESDDTEAIVLQRGAVWESAEGGELCLSYMLRYEKSGGSMFKGEPGQRLSLMPSITS